jgi:hypothetical protein
MKMGQYSETLAHKIQTLGNYPEESIQHSEHGESLKSRIFTLSELFRLGLWPTQPPNQWVPDFVPSVKVARE